MRTLRISIFLSIWLGLCLSCSNSTSENSENQQDEFIWKPGQTTEKIQCRSNNSFSYAVYLPTGFKPGQNYPLIIAFDAHARSGLALSRFKEAADNYGYIVIASNDARNGIQDINPIVNAIWDDAISRFPIDPARIYTAGFSGGARIAASVAIFKGGVKGVIACGGGMPEPGQELRNRFDFISVVGLDDLNYQELKTLDKALTDNGFVNQLITFSGGHEWPSSKTLSLGVAWLDLMSIKQKKIPVNDGLVRNYTTYYADSINNLIMNGQNYQAYLLYNILLKDLEGIYDISDYKASYHVLLKSPDIEQNKLSAERIRLAEIESQEKILESFKLAQFPALKDWVNKLRKASDSKDFETLHQTKRLLGFMGMLSFLYAESSLNSQNKQKFLAYIEIYELLEPQNPDLAFFKSCQAVMDNQPDKALAFLKNSVDLGLYDVRKMQNIGYLEELRAKPEFDLLLKKAMENFKNQK